MFKLTVGSNEANDKTDVNTMYNNKQDTAITPCFAALGALQVTVKKQVSQYHTGLTQQGRRQRVKRVSDLFSFFVPLSVLYLLYICSLPVLYPFVKRQTCVPFPFSTCFLGGKMHSTDDLLTEKGFGTCSKECVPLTF